jgi:hypothetical protein
VGLLPCGDISISNRQHEKQKGEDEERVWEWQGLCPTWKRKSIFKNGVCSGFPGIVSILASL